MYRCMTCDERRNGKPVFIPLGEVAEEIGVCPGCALVVRQYVALAAQAEDEYAKALAESYCQSHEDDETCDLCAKGD